MQVPVSPVKSDRNDYSMFLFLLVNKAAQELVLRMISTHTFLYMHTRSHTAQYHTTKGKQNSIYRNKVLFVFWF